LDPIVWLGLLVVIVFLAAALRKKKDSVSTNDGPWPLFPKRPLSNAEQVLYNRLIRAFPDRVILAQVALPAFLGVKKGENFQAWYNRFNRLYADFVVCEKDFRVVAVLELDDRSHDNPRRQAADSRKAAALRGAGIPLHRFNVNPMPDEVDLVRLLGSRFEQP